MDQQQALAEVHRRVIERFPMYQTHPAFEHWLLEKSGADPERTARYLDLIDDYGCMSAEGMLDQAYTQLPPPEGVEEDIERRLASLPPETIRALEIGSVEGKQYTADVIAAIEDIPVTEVEKRLRPAEESHMIVRNGREKLYAGFSTRYRFVPLQMQEYLYRNLSDDDRSRYHTMMVEHLSDVLQSVDDPGARELISGMIDLHNERFSRPASSPAKS